MKREDRIEMSQKELKRMEIVQKLMEKRIKQKEAAEWMNLSIRQVRRIVREVKNDNTISYESNLYQIMNHIGGGKTVQIENRMNQNLKIVYKEKSLNYQQLPSIIRKADISNLDKRGHF